MKKEREKTRRKECLKSSLMMMKCFKQLENIIQWLDSLKHIFREYSIDGYTNNKAVNDKYSFILYLESNHYISMHDFY